MSFSTPNFADSTRIECCLRIVGPAFFLAILVVVFDSGEARAQTCPLGPRPVFAGHTLPMEAAPSSYPMTLTRAFPALAFDSPVGFEAPPDGTDRIFVVEQGGRIYVFENRNDVQAATLFLDISSLVQFAGERGLLGLAFDPDYSVNRRFFLNYVTSAGCGPGSSRCTKLVRYDTSALDPDVADPASALEILEFDQPYGNHNGGAIVFGPDGMLYLATGDGGGAGDPLGHGQDISTPLGALLRLDVREGASSIVPPDNPFVGNPEADPLVFHYGFRNPWRVSFDRLSGDLLIADVGQGNREEANRVAAGHAGGLNFGWNACEGTANFDGSCPNITSVPPVIEYAHSAPDGGRIIIGGYVYRGSDHPNLFGHYIYSDASSMAVWAWNGDAPADPWNPGNPGDLIANAGVDLSSWGEDSAGELYTVSRSTGFVYQLVENGVGYGFPLLLSETGFFTDVMTLTASPGMIEYLPAAVSWFDSASKRRWLALPGSSKIVFHAEDAWQFPVGTTFVKHFSLPLSGGGDRRVETRVFLRQLNQWVGVTYRWNATQTDATLLTTSLEESIDLGGGSSQTWRYPSSNDCLTCHTAASGRVLGARTRQLGEAFLYPPLAAFPGGDEIQLAAWNCAGLFDIDIRDPSRYARAHSLSDSSVTRTNRFRSYVATNCSMCHQPLGTAPGSLDLRFETAIGDWNAIDAPVNQGDLGLIGPRLIATGDKARSMMWARQETTDATMRMALGTLLPHPEAVALIGDWIDLDMGFIDSDEDGVTDELDLCPNTSDAAQSDRDGDGVGDRCDPDDLPDLEITLSYSSEGKVVQVGDPIAFVAVVANWGLTPAGDFPVSFYLSVDQIFEPGVDVSVDHCWIDSIDPGHSTYCLANTTVTSDLVASDPSAYYGVVCSNLAGVVSEDDESGKCVVANTPVLLPEPSSELLRIFGVVSIVAIARSRRSRRR